MTMLGLTLQDAAVGMIAVAGAAVLVRRIVKSMRPSSGDGCPNCASGTPCAPTTTPPVKHEH